jgi:hypothetical protein
MWMIIARNPPYSPQRDRDAEKGFSVFDFRLHRAGSSDRKSKIQKIENVLSVPLRWIVQKKALLGCEIAGSASRTEADEMVALAQQMRKQVESWLRQNHPHLLRK